MFQLDNLLSPRTQEIQGMRLDECFIIVPDKYIITYVWLNSLPSSRTLWHFGN